MVDIAKKCLEFIVVFLVLYTLQYYITIKKIDKFDRKKVPINLKYLILKYKIDVVKLGYKRVIKMLNLFDSIIISFLFVITDFINNIYIRMIACFILIFPLFRVTYYLIAKYYRKECI